MSRRLMRGGHQLVVSDLSPDAVKGLASEGAVGSASLQDLVSKHIFKNADSKEIPKDLRYDLKLPDIAEVWRRGSMVSSRLLDLTAMALTENPTLSEYSGVAQDSGEGRWTIQAAVDEAVPVDVLSAALFVRFRSRQEHTFAEKMLSAVRQKFGGPVEPKAAKKNA